MPGDVGLVAKAVDTIASWFLSEDGFNEHRKRRAMQAKKEECRRALMDNDWDRLRKLTLELKRMSDSA
jgi:hypothetical protein